MQNEVFITFGHGATRSAGSCRWHKQDHGWQVELAGPFETVFGRGDDAFEALERAREHIEPAGWRVGLTGCRLDAWPSGMARDMGSGLRVYIYTAGSRPTAGDLADTFAPAVLKLVGDVTEQRARI